MLGFGPMEEIPTWANPEPGCFRGTQVKPSQTEESLVLGLGVTNSCIGEIVELDAHDPLQIGLV